MRRRLTVAVVIAVARIGLAAGSAFAVARSLEIPVPGDAVMTVTPNSAPEFTTVRVQGTHCTSDAGHLEVFFVADSSPSVRLAEASTVADQVGSRGAWSVTLSLPDTSPTLTYSVIAQCYGTALSPPGQQVLKFTYPAQPLTITGEHTLGISPTSGAPGTSVTVQGAHCTNQAGYIAQYLYADDAPGTRLAEAEVGTPWGPPSGWSVTLEIPTNLDANRSYSIGAQCYGTLLFPVGVPTLLFEYDSQPFTVTAETATSAPTTVTTASPPTTVRSPGSTLPPVAPRSGYWMLGADGHVYAFGAAHQYGNAKGPSVAIATLRDGRGYLVTDAAGRVSAFGTAHNYGGHPRLRAGERVTTTSLNQAGNGYWLFTNRGRAFAFGHAQSYGDMGATTLRGVIVASAASPTGHGYYMVGSDGGVFSFGDARFHGSTGAMHLNRPVVGISPASDNRGYWLVASDGGVFAFNAPFRGSMGGVHLNRPVNGIGAYGNGYLMVASDGGVFDFSNRPFVGSLADQTPSAPIIGLAAFSL